MYVPTSETYAEVQNLVSKYRVVWDGSMSQYIPVYPSIWQDIQVYLMRGLHFFTFDCTAGNDVKCMGIHAIMLKYQTDTLKYETSRCCDGSPILRLIQPEVTVVRIPDGRVSFCGIWEMTLHMTRILHHLEPCAIMIS